MVLPDILLLLAFVFALFCLRNDTHISVEGCSHIGVIYMAAGKIPSLLLILILIMGR